MSVHEAPAIAELADAQDQLLTLLLEQEGFDIAPTQAILSTNRSGEIPLSFAQQRLWFLSQMQPRNPVYNILVPIRLGGLLDAHALAQSLNSIVQRHEVLRTSFVVSAGQPMQIILPELKLVLPIIDLQHIPEPQRLDTAKRMASEEAQQPFDLAVAPLLRVKLLRLTDTDHLLLLTMHHIISDQWSMSVLINEVAALYQAIRDDQPSPLPELPLQYADYAIWQRQRLQGAGMEQLIGYWKKQLSGAPPMLELPLNRPRPITQLHRGDSYSFILPIPQSEAIKDFSQREGVTLFMTLLAAFQAMLWRYTNQPDMVIGTRIAGRDQLQTEPLIGFFVNILALRTNLLGNPTFRELLGRLREVTLGALAHQELPFEKLVEELHPNRDLSHHPLFNVMFSLQNTPTPTLTLPNLTLLPFEGTSNSAKYDLDFSVRERFDGLKCVFEYNTDLFEEATIARMANHFQAVLSGALGDPDQRLDALPMLSSDERWQILVDWNTNQTHGSYDYRLLDRFDAQAAASPSALALLSEDGAISYGELQQQIAHLAGVLRAHGVCSGDIVAASTTQSVQRVVAALAILKAGGTYLPLATGLPADRLAQLVTANSADFVLAPPTQLAHLSLAAEVVGIPWGEPDAAPVASDTTPTTANTIVWIPATAGQAGQPLGVAVPQRQLLDQLAWIEQQLTLMEDDIIGLAVPADSWMWLGGLLEGLLTGHPTFIPTDRTLSSDERLVSALATSGVTRLLVMPNTLAQMVQNPADRPQSLDQLRLCRTGGDRLPPAVARQFGQLLPKARLLHQYGTAEVGIATCYAVEQVPDTWATVPLGRPVANTQIYLLDPAGQPVAPGVAGEIYIAGAGVAPHYHNQAERSRSRFVNNPFDPALELGMYRSGDLGRYHTDGTLEFLGRLDEGQRSGYFFGELRHVEAVLERHAAVAYCLVVAQNDALTPQQTQLVAYIVPRAGHTLNPSSMRSFVKERLPEYLVPRTFVTLAALPTTTNGRVDRQALPGIGFDQTQQQVPFVPPQTPVESALADIWCAVLSITQVGVHDNFFALGGHSLLATQVISRVVDTFAADMGHDSFELEGVLLNKLFEDPTIAALAEHIETIRWVSGDQVATPSESFDAFEEIVL